MANGKNTQHEKESPIEKVENVTTKGEIARFEQFLLLPQGFQRYSTTYASESVYMWER